MDNKEAKPFVKWAGGKKKVIPYIEEYYPFDNNITRYIEPFVGGGAVLFDILNKFNLKEIYISDNNKELINAYKVIKKCPQDLIRVLTQLENDFIPHTKDWRLNTYNEIRKQYNALKKLYTSGPDIMLAAYFIFLNKTCFNGLYRVNSSNEFNVPMGDYKNPKICDTDNILLVSSKLKNVIIECCDYQDTLKYIDEHTFVYIDPPYRPITKTSNFTTYTKNGFDDEDQINLSKYINNINKRGGKFVLSNSDPKNTDMDDNYFDDLYKSFNIKRIEVGRAINSNGKKRGKINELLIDNI